MIGMQYYSNNLESGGGVTGFASYPPETKCQKDGFFTINEPISVLDTRSPSPSTSTSTFSSFNTTHPQPNMATLNLSHAVCENANLGFQDWGNFSKSAGKQDDIFHQLLQMGNENEVVGFGAIGSAIAPVSNFLTSYDTSVLGHSGSGFSLKGKVCLGSNSLLVENNGTSCFAPHIAFQQEFDTSDQKVEIFNPNTLLVRNAADSNQTNLDPLFLGTQQEQQRHLQSLLKHQNVGVLPTKMDSLNITVPFVDQLLPTKQQILPQMLEPRADFSQLHEMVLLVPKNEAAGGCDERMGVNIHQPEQQQELVYEHVYKAAEFIQAGNFSNAQGILARLNHFLAPSGKPFMRSAFYVKEALELALMMPKKTRIPAPFDGMFKMGAYKVFSEVSPVIQFMNFTANQVFLEAVAGAEQIHIIDFDICFGAHWSSLLQELPKKNRGVTSVKITAFASPSTHHSLEISLMHENLTHFANEIGIKLVLEVVNIDSFDPNCNSISSLRSSEREVIAVNFPLWSFASYLSALPSFLCLIKRLSPKIVVSLGRGCERIDLPFSHHILHTLLYYEALIDSVDSANVTSDASDKIEKFLLQPRIESTILGRLVYAHVMTPWKNLFASVGYKPACISNFSVTQAECVLKSTRVSGFHVERQQASLVLCWKCHELLSVSAWNC